MFKIFMFGAALTGLAPACTKLDEQIYSEVPASQFFNSTNAIIAALGPAYTNFGGGGGFCTNNSMYPVTELTSDEMMCARKKDGGWAGDFQSLGLHNYAPGVGVFNGTWTYCFGGISTCNRLIETFKAQAFAGSDQYIAELQIVRDLYYFWLLDQFGNVPVVTTFATAAAQPATSSRAQVYQFIVNDLQSVVQKLPPANGVPFTKDLSKYGRVNYYVAQTILAKLYLNSGVFLSTDWTNITPTMANMDSAIAACSAALGGPYHMAANFFDNFSYQDAVTQGSPEILFAIPYDAVQDQGMWLPLITLNGPSDQTYQMTTGGPWNGFTSIQEFYNSFIDSVQNPGPTGPVIADDGSSTRGTQDIRLGSFIVGPQYNVPTQFPNLTPPPGSTALIGSTAVQVVYTPFVNDINASDLYDGARLGKWQIQPGQGENANNDFAVLRVSDVMLMKAEALWRENAGDPTALALVNQVRVRAGVAPFASLTAANILAERGRELFGEGHRRTDQIRFGQYDRPWGLKPTTDDPHYNLFPIPSAQLGANPNLKQNPGY